MAQTHEDSQHAGEFMERLTERANEMTGQATITSGHPDEKSLMEWQSHGVQVTQRLPDEQDILRISVGGGQTPVPLNYCVFRGDHGACVDLLREALAAMEGGP